MAGDDSQNEREPYNRELIDPPASIVRDGLFVLGCFNGPVERANMLDVERPYHYAVPRWVKDYRCKRWRAFQFGNSRWFFFTMLQEIQHFGFAHFSAYDKERGRFYTLKRIVPLSRFGINERLDGEHIGYHGRHARIEYSYDLSGGAITLDTRSMRRQRRRTFEGSFSFAYNSRQSAPSTVCLPFGLNRAMYSTKVLMPMQGWFEADGERFEFKAPDAMGVMDDSKGFYPYRMRHDRVVGFGTDSKGRRVGFNLTDNQVRDQLIYNENVLWINSRVFPLPPIKVTTPNGPENAWHIQDTEGLVDLAFKPQRHNDTKLNLLVTSMDNHVPFGSFEGMLRSPDGGEKVDAKGLYGMGEQRYLRA
jgi:hypothetical protein